MKKFIFILFFSSITVFSQSETDIVGVNYNYYTSSAYRNGFYNNVANKIDAFVNYGHDLGKKTKLFYHLSYQNFDFVTKVDYDIIPQDDFILYPEIPNYSLTTAALGMTNKLKKEWELTNIFAFTIVNDTKDNVLKPNNYFRSFSYLKKKKTEKFSFGFGLYMDNVKEDVRFLPILSLEYKNKKRGVNLFFPRSLKLWQKLSKKTYVELKSTIDSNTLINKGSDRLEMQILSITNDLSYNYIVNNKFKFKAGLGVLIREYDYKSTTLDFETSQKPSVNFIFGVSYVVFRDN